MAELEPDLRDYTSEAAAGPPRRRPRWLAVAGVVVPALIAVGLALSAGSDDTVGSRATADADVPVGQASAPLPPRVDLQLAAGWQTLRADGELIVVGTHPLRGRDLALAALARDDAVFSDFPPDGVGGEHEAGDGRVVPGGQLDAEIDQVVDGEAARQHQGAVRLPLDGRHVTVGLVVDLPDDLLEEILHGHVGAEGPVSAGIPHTDWRISNFDATTD